MTKIHHTCLMLSACSMALIHVVPAWAATPAEAPGQATEQIKRGTVPAPVDRKNRSKKNDKVNVAPREGLGADTGKPVSGESGRLEGDIVVVGLKANVKTARAVKRNAQQIVDVVLAQDIGKLPDKNVSEALARVPGIQIDRQRGEGGDVQIRGIGGAMTTVNGSPIFSGTGRTTFLNDIQSDLIAGIEVYKTRTPDQVEGSPTGVINLSLRRPTDFKQGATYSVTVKDDYNDQSRSHNPYASALVAYNGDTAIGEMGFLINATYNYLKYNESSRWNGLPRRPYDPRQIIDPGTVPAGIYIPNDVGFVYRRGNNKRVGLNVSTEWKPNDRLRFTIEGSYTNAQAQFLDDLFVIPLLYSTSGVPAPSLTNLKIGPDGRLASSASVNSIDPIGPGKNSTLIFTDNYTSRFQVDYKTDVIDFTAWINYNKSRFDYDRLFHYTRFAQQPSFDVEFNTDKDPRGGMNLTFKNIDLLDPKNYQYIEGFDQDRTLQVSAELEEKFDLRVNTGASFVDWIKIGFRHSNKTYFENRGLRSMGNMQVPISALPDYTLTPIGKGFSGTTTSTNADWLAGDSSVIRRNWNAVRANVIARDPTKAEDLGNYYPDYDPFLFYAGSEGAYAGYAMAHFQTKLLVPVDGTVGTRIVNTLNSLDANEIRTESVSVDGGRPTNVTTGKLITSRGNYVNVLPSVNAIFHFTPKLQLRTSWTYDVDRPRASLLRPSVNLDLTNPSALTGYGGNPNLSATKTNKYDVSLEWYFGESGSLSIAAWKWDQNGYIQNLNRPEILPGLTSPVTVFRPYNGGRGKFNGVEASLTSFLTFLPGVLKSFGGTVNFTYNDATQEYPQFDDKGAITAYVVEPRLYTSKYVYNIIGFFERWGLNVRVAYNWRDRQVGNVDTGYYYNNQFLDPVSRLDASINYDITKNLAVSFEASNLMRNGTRNYFATPDLPRDVFYYSRNFSGSIRYKF